MGQELADTVDVHQGLAIRVVDGGLDAIQLDVFADHLRQLVVDLMARSGSDDVALDGFADEGEVANHVEQFVSCGLVGVGQRLVVYVAQFADAFVRQTQFVSDAIELCLRHFAVVDDDGVIEVAPLDESVLEEHFDLADEDKGA